MQSHYLLHLLKCEKKQRHAVIRCARQEGLSWAKAPWPDLTSIHTTIKV
jgi:hypothetical protein